MNLAVLAVVVLSVNALTVYVAPLLPIVVALITRSTASSALKGSVLAVLAVVTGLVSSAVESGTAIELDNAFLARTAVAFVIAVATYVGLSKPLGLAGSDSKVASVDLLGPLTIGKKAA